MKTITEMAWEAGGVFEPTTTPLFNRQMQFEKFAALVREQYREELLGSNEAVRFYSWRFSDGEYYEETFATKKDAERKMCGYVGQAIAVYTADQLAAAVLRAKEVK